MCKLKEDMCKNEGPYWANIETHSRFLTNAMQWTALIHFEQHEEHLIKTTLDNEEEHELHIQHMIGTAAAEEGEDEEELVEATQPVADEEEQTDEEKKEDDDEAEEEGIEGMRNGRNNKDN